MNSVAHDRYTYALSVDANKKPLELLLLLEQPPLLMMTLRTYGWALNGARVGHAEKERGGELAKWWRLPTTRVNLFSRFALVRFSISISIIFDKSLLGSQRHHHQHRHHPQAPPPPLESFSFATSQHQKHENERRAVTLEFIPFACLCWPTLCPALLCPPWPYIIIVCGERW